MVKIDILIGFVLLSCMSFMAKAQTVPVGTVAIEDYYRRAQLMGQLDSSISFTVRPIIPGKAANVSTAFYPGTTALRVNSLEIPAAYSAFNGTLKASLLPLTIQTQYNSHHPYGWNDGAMIPAKGLQTLFSAGVYAEYGPISIQLRPEILTADNGTFETFDKDHYDVIVARYYDFYNQIDLPARFGNKKYTRASWGQSSIRLNYEGFSVGLSTENLWWGPGMRNSLLMSNTAPGFKHLTLNTTRPVHTPIGSFEGQLIAGRLEGSGFGPLEPDRSYFYSSLYQEKPKDWRVLSGLVLSYQPKWVPGLFIGLTRSAQTYRKDAKGAGYWLPFFSSIKKADADEPYNKRDERSSLFMRWVWPEERAEIYFEGGQNNNSRSIRQAALQSDRQRGYLFGLRKIIDFNAAKKENIMIQTEIAQLQQTQVDDIMAARSWYINPYIRHGYTHRGEVLGAGIGPGANMQSLEISWFKELKRIGIQLERLAHNNDFYYYSYIDSQDPRRHWVDLSMAISAEWNYQDFVFNGKFQGIKSLNYQWYLLQEPSATTYWVNGRDAFNVQVQLGVSYRF